MQKNEFAITTNEINIAENINIKRNIQIAIRITKLVYYIYSRIIDIISGIIGTILVLPITLLVICVRFLKNENNGPIFFTQLRIGKDGKTFKMYKYRTMCENADDKLEKYLLNNKEIREEYEKYKKLKNDPRITKVGKILRKTSLDEFPQFLNILKGDMSLVGPRPYLTKEIEDMGEHYKNITKIKPGLTGYWQVNGRNDIDFNDRLNMDEYYIENRTILMYFKIIFKTIIKIIKREGAI